MASKTLINSPFDSQLDQIARLLILEGMAHLPVGTWSKDPNGMDKAKSYFAGSLILESWFSESSELLFAIKQLIGGLIKKANSPSVGIEDILQSAICGITVGNGGSRENIFWRTGSCLDVKGKVLKGKWVPMDLMKPNGFLSMCLRRFTGEVVRHFRSEIGTFPYEDSFQERSVILEVLENTGDELGQKIREWMKTTWKRTPQAKTMDPWLDGLTNKQMLGSKELAEKSGLSQVAALHSWQKGLIQLDASWRKNVKLQAELQLRMEAVGIPYEETDPQELFQDIKRKALKAHLAA